MFVKVVIKGKIKREEISSSVDLDVQYDISYKDGFTIFQIEGEDQVIFSNFLTKNYEEGHLFKDLSMETYKGRLVDVGRYGFGIFCDIGSEKDVLISLHSLRDLFGGKYSTREYIYSKGLIDGLCVDVDVIRIDRGTDKIWGTLNGQWCGKYLIVGNITVSNVNKVQLKDAIEKSGFSRSLNITDLCNDSFILSCSEGVDPPGILHVIGSRLRQARLGIVGEI